MCYKVTTHDFKGNEIKESDRYHSMCCWYDELNQLKNVILNKKNKL